MAKRLSKSTREEVRAILMDELEDIIMEGETPLKEKIKSIELIGREHGLFIERKQVNVDINTVVRQLTDDQLRVLGSEEREPARVIDVRPRLGLVRGEEPPEGDKETGSGDTGDKGPGPEDEPRMDQGLPGENREEVGQE